MTDRFYCNFGRCEDQKYISVGYATYEEAEEHAEGLACYDVINISVTDKPLHGEVYEK